jgi:ADP-L-glycero-D-manno-heptose 6-epimerase
MMRTNEGYIMNILLTGYNGFIGKNIFDTIRRKYSKEISSITSVEKNFMDNENWEISLNNVVKGCDVVLHIGAISDTMLQDQNEMLKYNYEFSRILFDSAEMYGKKVIYASSAANTGDAGLPSNIYGWSKYITEQYGINVVTNFIALRYFNVYGPGEEYKGNMASVAYQAWNKGVFKLFPNSPKRDFVYIDDVVDATLYSVFENIPSGIFEVGSGEAHTFEDVLDLMEIKYTYRRESVIPKGYQFYTEANRKNFLLGWQPKYNLKQGIREYKKYLCNPDTYYKGRS